MKLIEVLIANMILICGTNIKTNLTYPDLTLTFIKIICTESKCHFQIHDLK